MVQERNMFQNVAGIKFRPNLEGATEIRSSALWKSIIGHGIQAPVSTLWIAGMAVFSLFTLAMSGREPLSFALSTSKNY